MTFAAPRSRQSKLLLALAVFAAVVAAVGVALLWSNDAKASVPDTTSTLNQNLAAGLTVPNGDDNDVTVTGQPAPVPVLRHHDLPDPATEDAAGTVDEMACAPPPPPVPIGPQGGTETDACGLLATQDDLDDAIGSFHGACIVGAALPAGATIEWNIEPVAGGPTPAGVTEYMHPLGYPCVRWSAATTGTQQITATVTVPAPATPSPTPFGPAGPTPSPVPTGPTVTTIWFDPSVPLPLIKEWNDIDRTIIVAVNGNVGDTLAQNTVDLADWTNRDCSFIPPEPGPGNFGFCDNPNVDGQTLQVGGVVGPGGSVIANGRSFIDYTFGDHSDAGGQYSGPVDGADQTYTMRGNCGSVRVENPFTGISNTLDENGDDTTVLSSDKGVGFQIVPNSEGDIATTPVTANCAPGATICVTIHTEEDNLFRSGPLIVLSPDEEVCVEFVVGPPTNKTPVLAWAGQRVVVEADWAVYGGTDDPLTPENEARQCPLGDAGNDLVSGEGGGGFFGVQYTKQAGPGSFTSALLDNGFNDVDITGEDVIVEVDALARDDDETGVTDANSNCISRVIYESQDQGQVDITAFPVDPFDDLPTADPIGQQQSFVIYYMKFEDANLGIVPEFCVEDPELAEDAGVDTVCSTHLPASSDIGGDFQGNVPNPSPASVFDNTDDLTEVTSNVSGDNLLRVRVRGWVLTDNCPARDDRVGQNGEFIPANRCIFPDDWAFKAGCARPPATDDFTGPGGVGGTLVPQPWENCQLARELRPNFDTLWGPGEGAPVGPPCSTEPDAAGPFSLLDRVATQLNPLRLSPVLPGDPIDDPNSTTPANMCGDSAAPNADPNGATCRLQNPPVNNGVFYGDYSCRETTFPNGIINRIDAQMPSALVRFAIQPGGSGFIREADKNAIYTSNSNPFYVTHIPAEPWISPMNSDFQGYQWNSWVDDCPRAEDDDSNTCQYEYWEAVAQGPQVVSCPGRDADSGPAGDCDGDGIPDAGLGPCPVAPNGASSSFQYIVQPGDTLAFLALQFGVSVEALAAANGLPVDAQLVPGQVLTIPGTPPGEVEGCLKPGSKTLSVYSDNHGEAMAWINGDADLTFEDCIQGPVLEPIPVGGESPADIKVIEGFFCRPGDVVGESEVIADVDYPDKRKHFPIRTNPVDITWVWAGEKTVEVVQAVGNQFTRVTFRATDRDGFCFPTPSDFPVIGELVTFLIDSGEGTIVGVSPGGSIGAGGQSATARLILDPRRDVHRVHRCTEHAGRRSKCLHLRVRPRGHGLLRRHHQPRHGR